MLYEVITELGIKYIVNDAGDTRYTAVTNDATGVMKDGEMQPTHTFVRYYDGEAQAWVGQHGNNGYYGVQKRSRITSYNVCYTKLLREVHHNPQKPFIVHTRELGVKVLGTCFNVNAYENLKNVTVALVEGKVSVLKEGNKKSSELLQLNPSEVADYNVDENKIYYSKAEQIGRYIAWKDGTIVFSEDSMEKMVCLLENWYNVDIEVADKSLLNYHFTATFKDESLDQILKYLSISTSFKYRFVDPKEFGGSADQRRKIILYQ